MNFRAQSSGIQPALPGTGVAMPGGVSPAGPMSGFDQGLQAYHPALGRADKHSSNIVDFTGEYPGHGSNI